MDYTDYKLWHNSFKLNKYLSQNNPVGLSRVFSACSNKATEEPRMDAVATGAGGEDGTIALNV